MSLCKELIGDPRYDVTLSMAGVTKKPRIIEVKTRIGGFGGVHGLKNWLTEHAIDRVVDVTHPFATQMTQHAMIACQEQHIPFLRYERQPWEEEKGDHWIHVSSIEDAASELVRNPLWRDLSCQVFLTTGRQHLAPFLAIKQHHFIVRVVDPVQSCERAHNVTYLPMRGPFKKEEEEALFLRYKVDILVSKNSGGVATYPKIQVARQLGIPIIMVQRPHIPQKGSCVSNLAAVLGWLEQ